MNTYPLLFLTSSIDEGIMYRLVFRASDEMQVARHLLKNYWQHRRVFEDLRIDWEDVERLTPEGLLKAIHTSRVDGDSSCGIRLDRVEEKDVIVVDQDADSPA